MNAIITVLIRYALVIIFITLGGCATAYQPRGFTGGFSETQLDTNIFHITFTGNSFTSRERTNDFVLLRSAEITLQHGYHYFVIVNAREYANTRRYTTPTTAVTNYGYGSAITTIDGGSTYYISKPSASDSIMCFSKKPKGFAYNAQFVADSIRQKYGLQDTP